MADPTLDAGGLEAATKAAMDRWFGDDYPFASIAERSDFRSDMREAVARAIRAYLSALAASPLPAQLAQEPAPEWGMSLAVDGPLTDALRRACALVVSHIDQYGAVFRMDMDALDMAATDILGVPALPAQEPVAWPEWATDKHQEARHRAGAVSDGLLHYRTCIAMTHWVEVGKECICIHEGPGLKPVDDPLLNFIASALGGRYAEEIDGPGFMQILKIIRIETDEEYGEGHQLKLCFAEFPGEHYCACQFRPLEKLEDEDHNITKERKPENV